MLDRGRRLPLPLPLPAVRPVGEPWPPTQSIPAPGLKVATRKPPPLDSEFRAVGAVCANSNEPFIELKVLGK